jgi:RNA polymerase sigma factor (sigma-70 family)
MYISVSTVDHRRLFVEHLSAIERIAREVAHRNRLPKDVAEDFASLVRLRLMEDDCRILREHRGESSMTTYLRTVITRLCLDYRSRNWGRWRPSVRARALGVDALALERLVYRDGYTPREAAQILTVSRRGRLSEADIERLWAQLPERIPKWKPSADTPIDSLSDPRPSLDPVSDAEDAVAASEALTRALEALTPGDRMLLQLHFARGVSLVHLARMWHISRATIMRRLRRVLTTCRQELLGAGIGGHRLLELVRTGAVDLRLLGHADTPAEIGRLIWKDAEED